MKLSPYLMLESEVHGTGRLERMTMRWPEACEVGLMPTSILLSFDPCEEGGLTETEALCHGPKHIHLAQESEKLKGTWESSPRCGFMPNEEHRSAPKWWPPLYFLPSLAGIFFCHLGGVAFQFQIATYFSSKPFSGANSWKHRTWWEINSPHFWVVSSSLCSVELHPSLDDLGEAKNFG